MRILRAALSGIVLLGAAAAPLSAAPCESLRSFTRPNTTITAATVVAAGTFVPPRTFDSPPGALPQATGMPEICRVQGVLAPSADSHIEFEVWLPTSGWNGKYLGTGNGGFAGEINYTDLVRSATNGYAASSTDTGHKGGPVDAAWALGHLEKVADYGHRAIHETAVAAKAIINGFYGAAPRFSYFNACSNGGRQALMEAQRFPEDYDGIIAAAPALSITRALLAFEWNQQAALVDPAAHIPARKVPAIEAAVIEACDARDGVKDGVIDSPPACRLKAESLRCSGAETDACLTAPQVAALQKIYDGPRTASGQQLYPGFPPGGESGPGGWALWFAGERPGTSVQSLFAAQGASNLVRQDAAYSVKAFDVNQAAATVTGPVAKLLDADNPDLTAFRRRGGKLILYHGWSDPALSAQSTIDYYTGVSARMGAKETSQFVRLYLVPGMQHCSDGPGPNQFGTWPVKGADPRSSVSAAIERWVENGAAPGAIIASRPAGQPARTRPLCPYPQAAKYKGTGSTDDAANFECRVP